MKETDNKYHDNGTVTYIDVYLRQGFIYHTEGRFAIGESVGWTRHGVPMDDDGDDREALLGYMVGEYFEDAGAGRLRYLGPDMFGIAPLFQINWALKKYAPPVFWCTRRETQK